MVKKWTASEKTRIVLESLTTNIGPAELCRKYNLSPNTFYPWKDKFLECGKTAFSGAPNGNACKQLQKENDSLKRLIGELTIANDAFKKTLEGHKR